MGETFYPVWGGGVQEVADLQFSPIEAPPPSTPAINDQSIDHNGAVLW